jgi:hypothetical protein
MLLCDYVIRDGETNNKSLIGIFNRIVAPRYPVRHDRLHAFVALTDGRGEYAARMQIRGPKGEVIFGSDGKIFLADPLAVAEINFLVRGLVIPEPGRYVVEFICEGELLVDRVFDAVVAEGPPPPPPPEGPEEG